MAWDGKRRGTVNNATEEHGTRRNQGKGTLERWRKTETKLVDVEETGESDGVNVHEVYCAIREAMASGSARVAHVHKVYYTHTVSRSSAFSLATTFGVTKGLTRYRATAKKLTTRRYVHAG